MEESQNIQENSAQTSYEPQEQASGVSFPTIGQPKKSGGVKTFLIIGVLILVALLGFVIYKSASSGNADATPTPTSFENLTTPSDVTIPTITPSPSASASAKIDRSKVAIQIQNGTGITGEAAYLQTQLSTLGYTNVKVGNSESTVTATSATFSSTLDAGATAELTQKLNSIYQTVNAKTGSTGSFDVVIITGLKKGATPASSGTPKASGTGTPRASGSATPRASGSPSPTPSRTPSPTP